VERQAEEEFDAAFESEEGVAEGALKLFRRAGRHGGIGNTPVSSDRLTGPNRADFVGGVVTDGDDDMHLWRAGLGEFIPAFAAQAGCGQVGGFELFDGMRIDLAGGIAASAEGTEIGLTAMIQDSFGHDGPSGVAGAEEQNIVRRLHEGTSVAAGKIDTARRTIAGGRRFFGANEGA
jgi:hypothetical protein